MASSHSKSDDARYVEAVLCVEASAQAEIQLWRGKYDAACVLLKEMEPVLRAKFERDLEAPSAVLRPTSCGLSETR